MLNSFKIRLANLKDLDSLVELHWKSFSKEEHLAVRLGKAFIRAVYKWFITSPYTFTVVAEDGGQIIGLTTICDRAYSSLMFKNTLKNVIWGTLTHPSLLFNEELVGRLSTFLQRKKDVGEDSGDNTGVSHLAFIAVDKSARGKGIGIELLLFVKKVSRQRGNLKMRAGVYKGNAASIKMFQKGGFEIVPALESVRTYYVQADLLKD